MKHLYYRFFPLLAAVLLVGCGKDPELLKKSGEQEVEIASLRGELALLDEKLKNLPADRSAELGEARDLAESQSAELASLEKEVAELEARKLELKREFAEYKRKYAIR